MQSKVVITALIGMLAISTIFAVWPFFGAPWAGSRTVLVSTPIGSVATPEEWCKEARLTRQLYEDSRYRERYVEAWVNISSQYGDSLTLEEIRQAEEASYDAFASIAAAEVEYWCD